MPQTSSPLNPFEKINSPLQHLDTLKGVEVYIKRDDLIHPEVSGNKWRKLKYHYEAFRKSGKEVMLTFGGAFSNHIAATAALGKMYGFETKALVRGEEVISNPTLDFCRACGMEIEPISRKQYDARDNPEFIEMLQEALPNVYLIPEGGKGALGMRGCLDIMNEVEEKFDWVCVAGGTGTTMAGMMSSGYETKYQLFSALKGGEFLRKAIQQHLVGFGQQFSTKGVGKVSSRASLHMQNDYHFGGYGKVQPELIDFMNEFYRKYLIPLDPIYTGKMMFGIWDLLERGAIEPGTRILAIHSGGLQGIKGMNERLEKRGLQIKY